jgi:hypothetical protein
MTGTPEAAEEASIVFFPVFRYIRDGYTFNESLPPS